MKIKIMIFLAMVFMASAPVSAGIFKQDPVVTAMCNDNDLFAYATDFAKSRVYYKNDKGKDKILVKADVVIGRWFSNPINRNSWVLRTSTGFAMDIAGIIESKPRNLPPQVLAMYVRQACLDGDLVPSFSKISSRK